MEVENEGSTMVGFASVIVILQSTSKKCTEMVQDDSFPLLERLSLN